MAATQDADVVRILEFMATTHDTTNVQELAYDGLQVKPLDFGRKILLRADAVLDKPRLMELLTLYDSEQQLGTSLLAMAKDMGGLRDGHEKMAEVLDKLSELGLYHKLKEQNDVLASTSNLTRGVDAPAALQDPQLLEEFFDECPVPNAAELELLSHVTGNEIEHLATWFKQKRCRKTASDKAIWLSQHKVRGLDAMLYLWAKKVERAEADESGEGTEGDDTDMEYSDVESADG